MKGLLIAIAAGALLAVPATAGAATAAKDPRVPALQQKVNTLQSQVATLQQQVQRDELLIACGFATQDAYNIANLNLWAALLNVPPYNGPGPNDGGACSKLGLPAPLSFASHSVLGVLNQAVHTALRLGSAR
jgi:hypothetical protein